jgi:hypothetical protein
MTSEARTAMIKAKVTSTVSIRWQDWRDKPAGTGAAQASYDTSAAMVVSCEASCGSEMSGLLRIIAPISACQYFEVKVGVMSAGDRNL